MSHGNALAVLRWPLRKYSDTNSAPAGMEGRMYPGSLDCEALKNRTGTSSQISRNNCHESSDVANASFLSDQSRRNFCATERINHNVQGISASNKTGR